MVMGVVLRSHLPPPPRSGYVCRVTWWDGGTGYTTPRNISRCRMLESSPVLLAVEEDKKSGLGLAGHGLTFAWPGLDPVCPAMVVVAGPGGSSPVVGGTV